MPQRIVFEIDERPLSLRTPSKLDYVGRIIGAALHEPLLRVSSRSRVLKAAAASSWDISPDGCAHHFAFDFRRQWCDGATVLPQHFIAGLVAAARHPFWSRYLRRVRRGEASKRHLLIETTTPDRVLPFVLAAIDLSPKSGRRKRGSPPASNGPYALAYELEEGSLLLRPNRGYPGSEDRPDLLFRVQRDPFRSLPLYDSREIDVTCNTAFPFADITSRSSDDAFHNHDSGIFIQLETGTNVHERLRDRDFRLALHLSLDRAEMAKTVGHGIIPAPAFGPARFSRASTRLDAPDSDAAAALLARTGRPERPLTIGYYDYYPNAEIVQQIRLQLRERAGVHVRPKVLSFRRGSRAPVDLFLSLRYLPFAHPLAWLDLYTDDLADVPEYCDVLAGFRETLPEAESMSVRRATEILVQALPAIPLFTLRSLYMVRPGIRGIAFPDHAQPDFRKVRWET